MVNKGNDCPQISIFTVEGPLFFGAAQMFESYIMDTINHRPKVLILRMGKVPYMDTTGEAIFASIVRHFQKRGHHPYFRHPKPAERSLEKNTTL